MAHENRVLPELNFLRVPVEVMAKFRIIILEVGKLIFHVQLESCSEEMFAGTGCIISVTSYTYMVILSGPNAGHHFSLQKPTHDLLLKVG
jgi:hypothetical protein